MFNMTVWDFNCILREMGIQYRRGGHWNISDDLIDRDLVRLRTHVYDVDPQWTQIPERETWLS